MYATIQLVLSRTNTLLPPYGPKTRSRTSSGKDQGMWLTVTRRTPPVEVGRVAGVGADEAMGRNRLGKILVFPNPRLWIPIVMNLHCQSTINHKYQSIGYNFWRIRWNLDWE